MRTEPSGAEGPGCSVAVSEFGVLNMPLTSGTSRLICFAGVMARATACRMPRGDFRILTIAEGIETHWDAFRFLLLVRGVAGAGIGSVAGINRRATGGDEEVANWKLLSFRGVGVLNWFESGVCPFQGWSGDRVVRGEAAVFTGVCNNLR